MYIFDNDKMRMRSCNRCFFFFYIHIVVVLPSVSAHNDGFIKNICTYGIKMIIHFNKSKKVMIEREVVGTRSLLVASRGNVKCSTSLFVAGLFVLVR